MTALELLREATLGCLSPEAQDALVEALRSHLYNDADLEETLGLRTAGNGPNPRSILFRQIRNDALQELWDALQSFCPAQRAEVAADLLGRRARALDPPADAVEELADDLLGWMDGATLSASRIRAICT